ncbi:uncharacterized protein LOC143465835 [Clavelina lepadiformis]|uniref:uncharacterized protein LOC143465835 n=1 Tax=Clavelina lepadiformis TaxID=159417 RepID=UPI0040432C52
MQRFNISHRFQLTTTSTVALTKSESSDVIDDVGITEKDKISFYVIGLFLSTVSLYVIIALAYHRYRTHKRKKKETLLRKSESTRGRKLKGSSSPWLDNLSLIAAVFAFLNCLSDHPTMYTKDVSSLTCKVMQCFSFIFYAAGITSLYTFLWLRQRACYKSPTLAQMYSKLLTVLSSTILPVFFVMMVAGMALTATLWTFEGSEVGCVETSENRVPFIVLFSGSVAMQLTLLGLFVFPLKRHARFVNDSMPSDKLLVNLVKRSLVTTALCISADALAFILTMSLFHSASFIIINYIYDANLVCNVLCIVGSFADWQQRLVPCCAKKKNPCERRINSSKLTSSIKTSTTLV